MKIGIVDVDTSHPQNWIPVEREMGHEVIGVWDGGAVHPPEYVTEFAKAHQIPHVFSSLEEMIPEVDCAIIHGCDWDTHIPKARPFVEAGKPVLIDKPLAGSVRDLRTIVEWVEQGARITGGSSLRFCYEVEDYLAKPVEDRGAPHTVFAGCGVDEFNYGIHAYSLLFGLMNGTAASVTYLQEGVQRRIQINWSDGRMGFLVIGGADSWIPFHASIATEKGVMQFIVDNKRLWRAILGQTLPYLAGETNEPPVPIRDLIQPEMCAIAAQVSRLDGGREVKLSELTDSSPAYDGPAFAAEYRAARYATK